MFARQVLPEARLIKAADPVSLEAALVAACTSTLAPGRTLAGVFVFTPHPERYRSLKPQLEPLHAALKRGLRSLGVKLCSPEPTALARAWRSGAPALQVALVGRSSAVVSCTAPVALDTGGFAVAPWPAGLAPVPSDARAPSRAYRKLEETFAWLGRAPRAGEKVVDLGGAPGGWAWSALKRGAHVVAVDRAPLDPPAAGHPALTQLRGDAFTYAPPEPVQWLLCDVICAPPRSLELIERWARAGWCRHLIVTVKFKGETGNHEHVAPIAPLLSALGFSFARVKHMHNNHNEVEVFASRGGHMSG